MKNSNWKQLFLLGLIFAAAGSISAQLNLLGAPTTALGLFGFGIVLIAAGLSARQRA